MFPGCLTLTHLTAGKSKSRWKSWSVKKIGKNMSSGNDLTSISFTFAWAVWLVNEGLGAGLAHWSCRLWGSKNVSKQLSAGLPFANRTWATLSFEQKIVLLFLYRYELVLLMFVCRIIESGKERVGKLFLTNAFLNWTVNKKNDDCFMKNRFVLHIKLHQQQYLGLTHVIKVNLKKLQLL